MIERGDVVIVAVSGDYGKPRPAFVLQSDIFLDLPLVTVCQLTTAIRQDTQRIRLTVEPNASNGLLQTSQLMVDKSTTVPGIKLGKVIGRASKTLMLRVDQALSVFLGLGQGA